ncbi:hypothetical protein Q8F55_000293 [Vanrija albida]|uniref:Zn(2)-C6 fungal-type domain-containing protein n=1 Tax=Vanrija albida TaxID=181172 RepID=A0ABR3QDE9_9TREE
MPKSETSPHRHTPPPPMAGPSSGVAMSSTAGPSELPFNPRPPPLKRGDACLYCRKRRIRCSATKPSCHHCTKLKRECVYDSGKPTSRVRKLEDKVAELEGYLRAAHAANEQQPGMPMHASPHAPMHTTLPHSDGIAPGTVHGLAGTPYMYPPGPARDGMVTASMGEPSMPGMPPMTPRMSYADTPSSHYPLPMVSTVGSVGMPGHAHHHGHQHYRPPPPQVMQGHTAMSPPPATHSTHATHAPIRSTTPSGSGSGSVDAFPIDPALGMSDSASGATSASPYHPAASVSTAQHQQQQMMPRVAVPSWHPQFYPGNLHAPEISPSHLGRATRPQVQTNHVMPQGTMPVSHGSLELHVPLPSPSTTSGIPTPPDASRFQPYVVDADRASSEPTLASELGPGSGEWDPKVLWESPELVGVAGWLDANDMSPQARDQL